MSPAAPTINLSQTVVWMLSGGLMLFAGFLFSMAAYMAGIRAVDTLSLLFVIGAAGTQLALIVLYLINFKAQ